MSNLSSNLVAYLPDVAGARSGNRFAFQTDWAICELLERFGRGEDFIFLFDYHEDVVVLTSTASDFLADFYQVKTRDSNTPWKKASILKGTKSKHIDKSLKDPIELPSIMDKLYLNKVKFKDGVKSLNIVSNNKFSFFLKDGTKTDTNVLTCLFDLKDDEVKEFEDRIKVKYDLKDDCDFAKYTYFKVTELNLNGSNTYVTGKIGECFAEWFPFTLANPKMIYDVISHDITRKNNRENTYNNFTDLKREKGISSEEIAEIFQNSTKLHTDSIWTQIDRELLNDSVYSFSERRSIQNRFREIYIRMHSEKLVFKRAILKIGEFYAGKCQNFSLSEAITHIFESLKIHGFEKGTHDPNFIKALIIHAIYEQSN